MKTQAALVHLRRRGSLAGLTIAVACALMLPLVFAASTPAWASAVAVGGAEEPEAGASDNQEGSEVGATHARPAPEEHLRERVRARWRSLISGDFARAYEFETPGFRQATELDSYRASFGSAARWSGVDIRGVELAGDGRVATVDLLVSYEVVLPDGTQYPGRRPMTERWLFKEGDWWVVQQ